MTCALIDTIPRWSGGYLAHLKGILSGSSVPEDMHVVVHGTSELRNAIGPADGRVDFIVDDAMPMNPVLLRLWRSTKLPGIVSSLSPDVLFSPAGDFGGRHRAGLTKITMCHNLQPYIQTERKRVPLYRFGRLRLEALHRALNATFERADGVIFLSEHAREVVLGERVNVRQSAVIPHGISDVFRRRPEQKPLPREPVLLYVSDFHEYKHQWSVVRAVALLRKETGMPLTLHLVGQMSPQGRRVFEPVVEELGNPGWLRVTNYVPHAEMPAVYREADAFIFASTVETFGIVLLEAMASGLPIACSNRCPMTDMLGDNGGIFFEPEDPSSIASTVRRLLEDDELRYRCALNAYNRALAYSWERTARETYGFIRDVVSSRAVRRGEGSQPRA